MTTPPCLQCPSLRASSASTSPIIFLAVVFIELRFILAVEFVGIKLRPALYRLARKVDVDVGVLPIDSGNPLRRYKDFLSRQPVAGIDDYVANVPSVIVDEKIIDMADLAVGRLNRV